MKTDISDSDPQDWISSGEALTLVVARTGSEEAATRILEEQILEGNLKARAKGSAEQINFGPLPKQIPAGTSDLTTRVSIYPEGKFGALTLSSPTNNRGERIFTLQRCTI